MRHIGTIKDAYQAEKFSAHLTVEGIANRVEMDNGVHDVWVKDEDRLNEALHQLQVFQQDPENERYSQAIKRAQELVQEKLERQQRAKKNIVNVRERWPRGMRRRAPIAITLIVISCLVSFLTSFGSSLDSAAFRALAFNYADGDLAREVISERTSENDLRLRLTALMQAQFWRVLTPIFLHHGVVHLLFNMIWIYQLGRLLEDRFGSLFFFGLVMLTAVIPNFLQGVMPVALDGTPPMYEVTGNSAWLLTAFAGMSGVVYGLFGFAWIRSRLDPSVGFMIPQSTVIILIAWMLLGFSPFDEQWLGIRMANWGHGAGLAVGMIAAYVSVQLRGSRGFGRSPKA